MAAAPACPSCGYTLEETTFVDDASLRRPPGAPPIRPDDGDVSVCLACGDLGVFQVGGILGWTVRKATPAEIHQFLDDPEIVRLLEVRARIVGSSLRP